MSRFRRHLLGTLLVVATVAAPAGPRASAHEDACVVYGTLTTNSPLFMVGGPVVGVPFSITVTTGSCAFQSFAAAGTWSGYCAWAVGQGTATGGHRFRFTMDTSLVMVFSGGVTGAVRTTPDAGENCIFGADRFLATGSVTLTHATA